jgi:CheY-like chemotaxis protein
VSETHLRNRRVLLVEDEYFIADAMRQGLEDAGAIVVGPAASVRDALALLDSETVDGAILDVKLDDEGVFPVADVLRAREIPFLFATGYNTFDLPPDWRHVARLEKPVDVALAARQLFGHKAPSQLS